MLTPLNQSGKHVILGVVRVHEDVESVTLVKERATEALQYIEPGQLILAPDCGLVCISREAARSKLVNLTQAAKELNEELHKKARVE